VGKLTYLNLTENARPQNWTPNTSTSPEAKNQCVLDVRDYEHTKRESLVVGPVQFEGSGQVASNITALLDSHHVGRIVLGRPRGFQVLSKRAGCTYWDLF
jgi:hypothetical protein